MKKLNQGPLFPVTSEELKAGKTRYGQPIINGRIYGWEVVEIKPMPTYEENKAHPFKKFL